jgi:voltage-gated potassium channel
MAGWRHRWHEVIFEAETPAGKRFDVLLLVAIVLSVLTVLLESVPSLSTGHPELFFWLEWGFTSLFAIEYLARLAVVNRPLRYAVSFYGLVDLLSVLPSFVGLVVPGSASLRVIRILRLLRVFRVLKLVGFLNEAQVLLTALRASRRKILVFLFAVLALVTILGTMMYIIEDENAGFKSIPMSIYWAIVTVTTVGYGDIAPSTVPGQILASLIMIIGYAIIAVPTGIVGAELARTMRGDGREVSTEACPSCGRDGHDPEAAFCKHCGAALDPDGGDVVS